MICCWQAGAFFPLLDQIRKSSVAVSFTSLHAFSKSNVLFFFFLRSDKCKRKEEVASTSSSWMDGCSISYLFVCPQFPFPYLFHLLDESSIVPRTVNVTSSTILALLLGGWSNLFSFFWRSALESKGSLIFSRVSGPQRLYVPCGPHNEVFFFSPPPGFRAHLITSWHS